MKDIIIEANKKNVITIFLINARNIKMSENCCTKLLQIHVFQVTNSTHAFGQKLFL